MSFLADILHRNQEYWKNNTTINDTLSNDSITPENVELQTNFEELIKEFTYHSDNQCENEQMESTDNNSADNQHIQEKQKKTELIIDPITGIRMQTSNIGLKNFHVSGVPITIADNKSMFDDFAPDKKIVLIKFQRNNNEKIMPIEEVKQYVTIRNGKIVFLRPVNPDILYKITKALNNTFYFIVNSQDNIVPISPEQAHEIFVKKNNMHLNSNLHIAKITDREGNKIDPHTLQASFQDWFGKHAHHMHPYAYNDMVIPKQVKHFTWYKRDKNGRKIIVKTQFSNELTSINMSLNNIHLLRNFIEKCKLAFHKTMSTSEERVFTMPIPLYSKHHMLSLVIAFKPDGKINATIINANGRIDARDRYAIPLANILQKAFERYAPHIAAKINYFFHENHSQIGGTCMTHADVITKQLAKDPYFEKDGSGIHPIKIWEKAYIRGFATTIYHHAKRQGMFIPDDVNEVQNLFQTNENYRKNRINNNIQSSKQSRNDYEHNINYQKNNNYRQRDYFVIDTGRNRFNKNNYYISKSYDKS